MNNFLYNFYPILTEIFILLSICITLIYGVVFSSSWKLGYPLISSNLGILTLQILTFSLVLSFNQVFFNITSWNNFLVSDLFTSNAKCLIIFISIGWFLSTFLYLKNEKINSFEYWILILLAVVAILFILQSYDLLIVYLAIEFQSLIFYVLASFKRSSEFSTEAGLKYFVLGAFSSALLLFGSSLIYGLTGLSNLEDISKFFTGIPLNEISLYFGAITGLTLVIISLLFKLSAAPFHMWAPDVYEGSPTSITAFFSILPKLSILGLLYRFLVFSFYDFISFWHYIILISTLLSILIGTLSAFYQVKWKRFFAYSSINHVGFFLLPLLIGASEGVHSSIFYVIIYMVTMLGIFSFVLSLRFFNYVNHYQARYLQDLFVLSKVNPVLAISMTLILFSMAGIPPLAGFFSKVLVLLPAIQINALGISVFIVLMSCISCFYYIKLIKNMYFENVIKWGIFYPMNKITSLILTFSLFTIIFLFYDIEVLLILSKLMSLPFLN